jgi:uncharacterized protein
MVCKVLLEGEWLWLLADKAVYWPARRCLLIADAHFGKASAYRSLGQPVPQGTTTANLARLDRLLSAYACEQLIFLGDFLHGPGSQASGTLNALRAWRERNAALKMTLIRGNHDKRAGDPPADLRIDVVTEPMLMGKGRQSLRLPCFQIGGRISLLPAFGAFTGGHGVEQDNDRRIYVIGDHEVWPLG